MAVTIDTAAIPVPWERLHGRPRKYPFDALDVGASMLVTGEPIELRRAVWAARAYRKANPTIGIVWARNWEGLRIWRVDPATASAGK